MWKEDPPIYIEAMSIAVRPRQRDLNDKKSVLDAVVANQVGTGPEDSIITVITSTRPVSYRMKRWPRAVFSGDEIRMFWRRCHQEAIGGSDQTWNV